MKADKQLGRAVKWAYVMKWGEKGFSALFTLVLASLLGPTEFGIVAIAMIYVTFIQMLLEQGLVSALIQRKDLTASHTDSVFWANMMLSLVLLITGISFGSWWANANHTPYLFNFVCVLSLTIPLEGLSIVPRALLQRSMDFKRLSIRTNSSVLLGGTVGVLLAFKGFGPWALVGQRLCQDLADVCLLWHLSCWRPKPQFSIHSLRELVCFSSANFISKLSFFANNYCCALILGLWVGPSAVGIYRLAERLMSMVLDLTTTTLQTVSLPQFSRVQDNPEKLRESMMFFIRWSSIVALPLMGMLAASSLPLMRLLGAKWVSATPVVRILCVSGFALSLAQFIGPFLQAISKPFYGAAAMWTHTILSVSLLLAAARYLRHAPVDSQVLGIAATRVTVDIVFLVPLLLFVLSRFCSVTPADIFSLISTPAFAATSAFAIMAAFGMTVASVHMHPAAELIIQGLSGSTAGLITTYWLDRNTFGILVLPISRDVRSWQVSRRWIDK